MWLISFRFLGRFPPQTECAELRSDVFKEILFCTTLLLDTLPAGVERVLHCGLVTTCTPVRCYIVERDIAGILNLVSG